MASQIIITESMIRKRAANKSYARGESLYRDDAIYDVVKRGDQIEGYCTAASQYEPYHVQAWLGKDGISQTACTCLYEFGGDCKHVVALLLTYLHAPGRFDEQPPIEDVLASRNKEQLIVLIRQMVARYPDLQAFIDRPLPGESKASAELDTAAFRKELRRALRPTDEWGDHTASHTVRSIMQTADSFAEGDDWRGASTIYRTIIEEIIQDEAIFYYDEDGDLAEAVDDIVDRLGELLTSLADNDQERRLILDSLLALYLADIDVGDVGADAPDVILQFARAADLPAIRKTVLAAQKKAAAKPYGQWQVEGYAEFLANLDLLDNVDPEVILARLRDEGHYSLLVSKLLEYGRVDEAVKVIEHHLTQPYQRLPELRRLNAVGRLDDALRLAEATLKIQHYPEMIEWLLAQLQSSGDPQRYFQWQLRRMYAAPDEAHYAALKAAAPAKSWAQTRDEIIRWLKKEHNYPVLTRVYLHDGRWDDAWEAWEQFKASGTEQGYGFAGLEMEVVGRTRHVLPRRAIPVYIKQARRAIGQRNRDDYRRAAEYLSIIRDLYGEIDEPDAWEQLIKLIREEFKKLPALQDELRQARL